MVNTLIITRGIPASGKTTWAKAWLTEKVNSGAPRARVNRDDIRYSAFGKGWGVDEMAVTKFQNFQLDTLLGKGFDVVVDNTNLKAKNVKELLAIAAKHNAQVEFKDFPVNLETALMRDALRTPFVGAEVIGDFYSRFVKKGQLPPVPTLTGQAPGDDFPKYTPIIGLPHAVLVDIDGTLAHMTNRGPYDTSKYLDDSLDWVISELIGDLAFLGKQIVVMSGRDAKFRDVLKQWLDKHKIPYNAIFMRPEGDERNDAIVKNELFEQHIKDNYYVDFVLDDRDRVVDMWRAKGIKCLQVEPGNF